MTAITVLAIYAIISPYIAIITIALEKRFLYIHTDNVIDRMLYFLLAFFCWWFVLPYDIFIILRRRKR